MVMGEENKWKSSTSMETPRHYFGATAIGERIYVAGGCNYDNVELSSAEVYDSNLNKWSSLPNMMIKREGCAVTSVNGNIYAVGGSYRNNRNYTYLSSCEMFDPDTNKWTPIPDMKVARTSCAACAIGDKLYVIGGYNNVHLDSVEVFDTVTQEWSSIPNMEYHRQECAAVSLGNKIYVFGGYDGRSLSSAEVYDIATQEWSYLLEMNIERCNCAATVVGNRIYVIGGEDDDYNHLSYCEVFDVSTNTWSWSCIIPDMNEKRYACQAVSIGAEIYAMGSVRNNSCTSYISSVEKLELSMSSLYPIHENYVMIKGGYYSPKSLENLCIDQVCRSLPDLDGEIPPIFPQDAIDVILESLVSHDALTLVPLEAFRHYKLDQLTL